MENTKLQATIEVHPAFAAGYFALMNIIGKLHHIEGATPPEQDEKDFKDDWGRYKAGWDRAKIDFLGG